MLFNSFRFLIIFLPVSAAAYYLCARYRSVRTAQAALVLFSLIFYAVARPAYVFLLIGSILFNYGAAQAISRAAHPQRKRLLIAALTLNVLFLASFKYVNFLFSSMPSFLRPRFSLPDWAFPLGISFFTLQQVMYLVDCYQELVPANDLLPHAAWVSFFPSVTAGPLTRARKMMPQIQHALYTDGAKISQGITLCAIGLCKKVILADSFSRIPDVAFAHFGALSIQEAWISSLCYTFQMYFDFSGYSDLAIGIALLLGYTLPINFNAPYRSLSIIEFWQRWHITLSQFITTYLYTPILRSFKKASLPAAMCATFLAMTISGLWHGASAGFIWWGALHGIGLSVNQLWRRKIRIPIPKLLSWMVTFFYVNLTLIFFRSPNLRDAFTMCQQLFPHPSDFAFPVLRLSISGADVLTMAPAALIGIPVAFWGPDSMTLSLKSKPAYSSAFAIACLLYLALIYMNSNLAKEFIYFAF